MSAMDPPRSRTVDLARRFLAVVQDPRGYPAAGHLDPAPPDGPEPPVIHSVVKADDYELLEVERDRYREALEEIVTRTGQATANPNDSASRAAAWNIARRALKKEATHAE